MKDELHIKFQDVSKSFPNQGGEFFQACRELSFEVKKGEIVAIVGETGCGKSTSFNMLLGVQKPDTGEVRVLGYDPFSRDDELKGKVGIIFQNDRLLPWCTAVENVALGLKILNVSLEKRLNVASKWLKRVGLEGFETSHPHELSGGMRQRVSIARAFSIEPKILYADEAFTALDELTASRIRKDLLGLIKETEITTLFITHSVSEAVEIAERILVFSRPGRVILEINCKAEKEKDNPINMIEDLVRDGLRIAREAMLREGTAEDVTSQDIKNKI